MSADRLEVLWEQYCCRLLAFIRGRVSNEAEAEDILQEVFLRVHRQLCCASEWEKPDAWFYQIARNLIIDYYRRRKESVEIPEDFPELDDPIPTEDDPETRLALSLKETILELPEPYRQALILTEYEGISQKEMSERLGISFSGAKSRVQRARQKLRDLLLVCCHFELDRRGRVIDYSTRCRSCDPDQTV